MTRFHTSRIVSLAALTLAASVPVAAVAATPAAAASDLLLRHWNGADGHPVHYACRPAYPAPYGIGHPRTCARATIPASAAAR